MDVIKRLIALGADVNRTGRLGQNVVTASIYWERFDLIPYFLDLGFDVNRDIGRTFRNVIGSGQLDLVKLFLARGVNLDLFEPDQVYSHNPSPCHVAARHSLELVRLLVDYGASVLETDLYGYRPYHLAANEEIRQYFRTLEPAVWHDKAAIEEALLKIGVPRNLIEFLNRSKRTVHVDHEYVRALEFSSLTDVRYNSWMDREFIDLVEAVKVRSSRAEAKLVDYGSSAGVVVWFVNEQIIGVANYEDDRFQDFGDWDSFLADPAQLFR